MKEREKLANNTIVTTVMSNFGLYKALDALGIRYEKTDVGDKYVYENMRANGHLIGGGAVWSHHLWKVCQHRRWYPHGHQAYAGHVEQKGPAVQIDARSEDLSSGLEECARTG